MQKSKANKASNPNLINVQAKEIFKFNSQITPAKVRDQVRIAMPRVLNMWMMGPFFNSYFLSLGLTKENIIWSTETNEKMSKEGMKYGSIDPCFPAKVAQAHFHQLLFHEQMNYLYFPAITHTPNFLENVVASTSCPVVQGTPLVMKASFTTEKNYFSEKNTEYITDAINFDNIDYLEKQLFQTWGKRLNLSKKENAQAIRCGLEEMLNFEKKMQSMGREILERAEAENSIAILLIGRPYHLDSGLNHQILDEMQNLGFPILTMTSIPKDKKWLSKYFSGNPFDIRDVWPENFSTNSAQKVWAAKLVARNPHLAVIDISSFKCGHDAPTYGIIDSILSTSKAPYLTLHDLDQTSPTESFKIRLKTFAYNLNKRIELMKRSSECKIEAQHSGLTITQEHSAKMNAHELLF